VGFTFSFPIQQTGLASGSLIVWTKNWTATGVEGEDVVKLLMAACDRIGFRPRIEALISDTVGTLMTRRYMDPHCVMGVIFGTGTNAAYIERKAAIPKWGGTRDGIMVINTEWGGFGSGKGGRRLLPLTHIDHILDRESANVTEQRYEKMISGEYMGEMCRLALMQLQEEAQLWGEHPTWATDGLLTKRNAFGARYMSDITADDTPELAEVGRILREKGGVESTFEQRDVVKSVCVLVGKRGARLAAAGVAATLAQMGSDADERSTVAIDGSVFLKHPYFRVWMEEALAELQCRCRLVTSLDGSGIGAAVTAAVAESQTAEDLWCGGTRGLRGCFDVGSPKL
jgi:hexokinase